LLSVAGGTDNSTSSDSRPSRGRQSYDVTAMSRPRTVTLATTGTNAYVNTALQPYGQRIRKGGKDRPPEDQGPHFFDDGDYSNPETGNYALCGTENMIVPGPSQCSHPSHSS
jgi:hypothetical protein